MKHLQCKNLGAKHISIICLYREAIVSNALNNPLHVQFCKYYYCKLLKWITAHQPSMQLEQAYKKPENQQRNYKNEYCTRLHNMQLYHVCQQCRVSYQRSQEAWQLALSIVISQLCYGSYRQTCTLFVLKRSYCCFVCPSRGL